MGARQVVSEPFRPTSRMFAICGTDDQALRYVVEAKSAAEAKLRSACIAAMLRLSDNSVGEPIEVASWPDGAPVFLDAYFSEAVIWVPPREELH